MLRAPLKLRAGQTPQLELPGFALKVPDAQKVHAFAELLTKPPEAELPARHWEQAVEVVAPYPGEQIVPKPEVGSQVTDPVLQAEHVVAPAAE